ncbi:MAG: glycosyltransferase [Patulibacter minatonensis]
MNPSSPARIALVNKFFYPHAGAETVFFLERELLRSRGHEIVDFGMQAPGNVASPQAEFFPPERRYVDAPRAERARSALTSVYSPVARRSFSRLLAAHEPELVHFHNVYHQLTLSVVDAARAAGVPTVMTLHDFKIGCPSYSLFRDGAVCHDCVGGSAFGVVKHRCIKGSTAASALAYAEAQLARTRRTYAQIDHVIAPSGFVAEIATEAGFPEHRITVIPNALSETELAQAPAQASLRPEPVLVVAGRLDEVKGIAWLAELFAASDLPGQLRIIGDGPHDEHVARIAAASDRVTALGRLPRDEVAAELRSARVAAIPSIWEENCPMALLEARAAGTAVVCSDAGGLPSLVTHGTDGLLAAPGDAMAWTAALRELLTDAGRAQSLAGAGLERLRRHHGPDAHYDALMAAYAQAASHAARRGRGRSRRRMAA